MASARDGHGFQIVEVETAKETADACDFEVECRARGPAYEQAFCGGEALVVEGLSAVASLLLLLLSLSPYSLP